MTYPVTLFPLQYTRQQATPVDVDITFDSTDSRIAYLGNPRRYAGMIVGDNQDEKAYQLNAARSAWIQLGGGGGGGGGPTVVKWVQFAVGAYVAKGVTNEPISYNTTPIVDYLGNKTSNVIIGMGTLTYTS